jgi:thiamine-monophosphate kinase
MAALSEFELIRRYFTHPARGARLGVGDDAALVATRRGMELAVATDMLVCGRHFFRDAAPQALGHKALAVNLSDMAAMGARPRWATLALALPSAEPAWLRAFSRGFMALARRHGVDLIGGDTTRGPLAICVQIIGEVPAGRALRRDGARSGDDIWISGHPGEAALALAALRRRVRLAPRDLDAASRRLHAPAPRVALGMALRGVASSAIDVSDGLVADLGHICESSALAAVVEFADLPISALMRRYLDRPVARAALLAGGDDYELCFTAPPSKRRAVLAVSQRIGPRLTRIGCMQGARRGGRSVTVLGAGGAPMRVASGGFDHFG